MAPEAGPAEVLGAEEGVALIKIGGVVSTVGASLKGYADAGLKGAFYQGGLSFFTDKVMGHVASAKTLTEGVKGPGVEAISALLSDIVEALRAEEKACAEN